MEEIWKDVVGYEGRYEVSNKGNIRSKNKYYFNMPLKKRLNDQGYEIVALSCNGKSRTKMVHVLVLQAFDYRERKVGYDKNLVVDHKDGNRTNNTLDNLEWCTQRENLLRSIRKGNRGRPCVDIETGEVFKSMADAARSIGVKPTKVKLVCDGIRKHIKGHHYKYIGTKGKYKTRR